MVALLVLAVAAYPVPVVSAVVVAPSLVVAAVFPRVLALSAYHVAVALLFPVVLVADPVPLVFVVPGFAAAAVVVPQFAAAAVLVP